MSARVVRVIVTLLLAFAAPASAWLPASGGSHERAPFFRLKPEATRSQSGGAAPVDPIRCWWRTSAGAVAIGEPFGASLTCALRDDDTTRVTLDESRLGAAVVQLAPFEVLGGTHPGDLRTPAHRLLQYHYSLRIIDRDVIGRDAKFPDLQLAYKVQTRVGADANEGRDRVYVVPGQPVRVLSLVPVEADDIRDSGGEDFATASALRFRGRALRIAALGAAALGLLVIAPAVLRLVRGPRRREERRDRLDASRVMPEVAAALTAVEAARSQGWTVDLAARAAAATRLAAACALDRRIAQRLATADRDAGAERITVQRGWPTRTRTLVSSPVTPLDLEAALAALPLTTPAPDRQVLEDLRHALSALTSAIYGQGDLDDAALGEALAAAMRASRHLRRVHAWPRSALTAPRAAKAQEARA